MAILGKIGQALGQVGRFYTSPEGLQNLQATFQDMANPGGGAFAALQARRDRLMQEQKAEAQRQQMLAAYGDLAGMMAAPDAQIEGANELVAGANPTAARMGMAPLPLQASRPTGFTGNPEQMRALMQFVGAGGGLDAVSGLAGMVAPKRPNMSLFNTRSGVVGIDPESGEAQQLYSDPYAEALAEEQIAAVRALAGQRAAAGQAATTRAEAARINALRPRATGGGWTANGKSY